MNCIDALIAMPLLMGLYRGYRMGFLRQLATIVIWILGLYGSVRYSPSVSMHLRPWISEKYLTSSSFVVTFFLITAAVYLIRKSMEWGLRAMWMYQFNRILGAFFGLLKSLFFVSVSVFLFHEINKGLGVVSPKLLAESTFFMEVMDLNDYLYDKAIQWFQQFKGLMPF